MNLKDFFNFKYSFGDEKKSLARELPTQAADLSQPSQELPSLDDIGKQFGQRPKDDAPESDYRFDLAFVMRDCGGDIAAAQRRIDRLIDQMKKAGK